MEKFCTGPFERGVRRADMSKERGLESKEESLDSDKMGRLVGMQIEPDASVTEYGVRTCKFGLALLASRRRFIHMNPDEVVDF